MKRIIFNTIIIIISFITFNGCTEIKLTESNLRNNNKGNSSSTYYDYYMIHSGYIGKMYQSKDASIIITSRDELNEYIRKYDNNYGEVDGKLKSQLDKYDAEYFKTKSLVLCYIELSSGSDKVTLLGPSVNENTIKVNYKVEYPEIGTCDMNGYIFVIEVDKEVNEIKY